jgi:equilibrative nucleoside transporter 1/2/3
MQLDVATMGKGGIGPFIGTCIISASFGVANGYVQGGMTGDLSLMCPEFIQVQLPEFHSYYRNPSKTF